MGHATIIELNGKKYDALTGQEVADSVLFAPHSPKRHKAKSAEHRSVDGVLKKGRRSRLHRHAKKNAAAESEPARQPSHLKRQTQKANTLMRSAVRPPRHKKGTGTMDISKPAGTSRHDRAKEVSKSSFIGRFGTSQAKSRPPHTNNTEVSSKPVAKAAAALTAVTAPALAATAPVRDRFEQALQSATAHAHKPLKKTRAHHKLAHKLGIKVKTLTIGTALLAALVGGGYFAYLQLPRLAIKVAAARAGFRASLPDYSPTGFVMDNAIQYKNSLVTINFRSSSDDRNYAITQQPSEWSSESLLNNFVGESAKPFQTFQDKGRTIYIYDNANATWVDGGIWYKVESNNSLNSDQLLNIANSL